MAKAFYKFPEYETAKIEHFSSKLVAVLNYFLEIVTDIAPLSRYPIMLRMIHVVDYKTIIKLHSFIFHLVCILRV